VKITLPAGDILRFVDNSAVSVQAEGAFSFAGLLHTRIRNARMSFINVLDDLLFVLKYLQSAKKLP